MLMCFRIITPLHHNKQIVYLTTPITPLYLIAHKRKFIFNLNSNNMNSKFIIPQFINLDVGFRVRFPLGIYLRNTLIWVWFVSTLMRFLFISMDLLFSIHMLHSFSHQSFTYNGLSISILLILDVLDDISCCFNY